MILTKDNIKLGIVLGFLAPLIGMVLFYFYKFSAVPFKVYLQYLVAWKSLLTSIISISLIANAIIFTIYINTKRDFTAKGIFIATCIYAIVTLIIKLIL